MSVFAISFIVHQKNLHRVSLQDYGYGKQVFNLRGRNLQSAIRQQRERAWRPGSRGHFIQISMLVCRYARH